MSARLAPLYVPSADIKAEGVSGRYRVIVWIMYGEPVYSILLPNGYGGWNMATFRDGDSPKRAARLGTHLVRSVRLALGLPVPGWMEAFA